MIDADSFVQEHPLAFVRDVINEAETIIETDQAGSKGREMNNSRIKCSCIKCPCWDSDRNVCTMPQSDMWYACPIKSELPENKKALEEFVKWVEESEGQHGNL